MGAPATDVAPAGRRPLDLTVIMPTYNGAAYVERALASLVDQQAPPREVVVVDDGSTDETIRIVRGFADRLPLHLLQPSPERSWMRMTNIGLRKAKTSWTAILHQDDVWTPERGTLIAPHLAGECAVVVTDAMFVDASERPLVPWQIPRHLHRAQPERIPSSLLVQNWLAVPAVTFRTDDARAVGGLDPNLWYTADWDLWLKLALRGPLRLVEGVGAHFRIHGASQTVKGSRQLSEFRDQMAAVLDRHQWAASGPAGDRVLRAARLSIETNVALAGAYHGVGSVLKPWLRAVMDAGPGAIAFFAVNSTLRSRLAARVLARARGRLS